MSKAVLMSIQPKWVEKIASGEKTIEVRKTKPKLETPFKCYIYCSKDKNFTFCTDNGEQYTRIGNGKVIGEFVCDRIYEWNYKQLQGLNGIINTYFPLFVEDLEKTCLTYKDLENYGKGKRLYGWRITNLKIYEKPKELSEFYTRCNTPESKCKLCDNCYDRADYYGRHYAVKKITRPPESWFYVED